MIDVMVTLQVRPGMEAKAEKLLRQLETETAENDAAVYATNGTDPSGAVHMSCWNDGLIRQRRKRICRRRNGEVAAADDGMRSRAV